MTPMTPLLRTLTYFLFFLSGAAATACVGALQGATFGSSAVTYGADLTLTVHDNASPPQPIPHLPVKVDTVVLVTDDTGTIHTHVQWPYRKNEPLDDTGHPFHLVSILITTPPWSAFIDTLSLNPGIAATLDIELEHAQ